MELKLVKDRFVLTFSNGNLVVDHIIDEIASLFCSRVQRDIPMVSFHTTNRCLLVFLYSSAEDEPGDIFVIDVDLIKLWLGLDV